MDKSLDDIIKSKPRQRHHRRGGNARQQILGKNAPAKAAAAKARAASAAVPAATATTPQVSDKIMVSNLPIDVTQEQVHELFRTTVGPLREVTLHYDANGKSKGIASVHFQRKGDGTNAYNQYNNRLIDGKRPMKIEVIVDPSKAASSLVARVAPPPVANGAATNGAQRNGPRPGMRRKKGIKTKRPQKSAADLDAEMEDYTSSNAPAAAPAAA